MRKFALAAYGILVITSGIWRHVETGGSPEALWFGIVMGGLSFVAAGLMFAKYVKASYEVAIVPILFVGAWFIQRLFVHPTDGVSPRVILITTATMALIIILTIPVIFPKKQTSDGKN